MLKIFFTLNVPQIALDLLSYRKRFIKKAGLKTFLNFVHLHSKCLKICMMNKTELLFSDRTSKDNYLSL